MSRDDIQKLLGGYATGTLTPGEQEALFAAALEDQDLFDALAREQSLRDLLRDPAARAQVLAAIEEKPRAPWLAWWRPVAAGIGMAAVVVLAVVVIRNSTPRPKPVEIAVVAEPPAMKEANAPATTPVIAPPEPQAKKKVASEVRREAAAAPSAPREEPAGLAGGVIGGAIAPRPLAAPLPPSPPPPPVQAENASRDAAVPPAAPPGPSARAIFLATQATTGTARSTFASTAGQQGQVQARQQSPAAERDQLAEAKAIAPVQAGVRYSVADGRLRIETNDYGMLSVMARGAAGIWRTVSSIAAQPGAARLIELRPEEKEIFVTFSRSVQTMKSGVAPPQPGDDPPSNLMEKDGETTYVANPLPGMVTAGRDLSFTIRLP